jgi:hypothetical protein
MDVRSLFLQFNAEPPAELFRSARGGAERLRVLREFYAPLKKQLRAALDGLPVEVKDLEAMGAVVVRGAPGTLDRLTRPGGVLNSVDVSIAEDAEFVPLAH